MKRENWTDCDSERAKKVWLQYQEEHDISSLIGKTVGIDPNTKQIWFGDSAYEIVLQRLDEGLNSPLYFERVGFRCYLRKGGRR